MKVIPYIFLAGMMSFSTAAFAAEEVPEFKKADADGSTFVEDQEFAKVKEIAEVKKELAELDDDKDGKLSKKEYSVLLEEECE